MKHLYFVRHGQSEANASDVFSTEDTPLTDKGRKQASMIFDQCCNLPIDKIIASPLTRTRQTAEIINEKLNIEIIEEPLWQEVYFPSETQNVSHQDARASEILAEIQAHASDPSWHWSDEENFSEFRDRVHQALETACKLPEDDLLIVTHSHVLEMTLALILQGSNLDSSYYYHQEEVTTTDNTGVTYARRHSDRWELVTWNNFSHLADMRRQTEQGGNNA